MDFYKMEGLGNDFIVTHGLNDDAIGAIQKKIPFLCHRRRGIGADGVIFMLPSENKTCDYRMRIFNSDGSEAQMCGNGIRCLTLYLHILGMTQLKKQVFETGAGIIETEIRDGSSVRVNMGKPVLNAPDIPVAQKSGSVIGEELDTGKEKVKVTCVSMGNPHAVLYRDELTDGIIESLGPVLESHSFFPEKANIEFVLVKSDKEIDMRVYERGCGETMACGTGACAAVVSGILNKKHGNWVTVHLPGGDLYIEWSGEEDGPVFMTGPAEKVFRGNIEI